MNNCKYAYQSYQHLMIRIKTALRLGQHNSHNLVNDISNLDNFFVDVHHQRDQTLICLSIYKQNKCLKKSNAPSGIRTHDTPISWKVL